MHLKMRAKQFKNCKEIKGTEGVSHRQIISYLLILIPLDINRHNI